MSGVTEDRVAKGTSAGYRLANYRAKDDPAPPAPGSIDGGGNGLPAYGLMPSFET
jgi:hypothetical protein